MDAKEARVYLSILFHHFKDDGDTKLGKYVEALQVAIDGIAPPSGAGYYQWVYLPDADMMAYEHLEKIRHASDLIDKAITIMHDSRFDSHGRPIDRPIDRLPIPLYCDECETIEIALLIYRTILIQEHKSRIQADVRNCVERLSTISDMESE